MLSPQVLFLQAVGMFLGEFSCLAAFYLLQCRATRQSDSSVEPQQSFSALLFLPPALCDMTGTSLMYVGKSPAASELAPHPTLPLPHCLHMCASKA